MGTRILLLVAGAVVAMAQSGPSLDPSASAPDYVAITPQERIQRVVSNTIGPVNVIAGVLTSAQSTLSNSPPEYGPHWEGLGKRVGLRMSGAATSGLMEASFGSLWGEDPRYFRDSTKPFKNRLSHVVRMTFVAHNRSGNEMPAYARYLAIPGSAFLTNAWRPDSQTQFSDTIGRIALSLATHIIGNAFSEFGPDLRRRFSRNKNHHGTGQFAPVVTDHHLAR